MSLPATNVIELKLPLPARKFLATLAANHATPWEQLPTANRERATQRQLLVERVLELAQMQQIKTTPAVELMIKRLQEEQESTAILSTARALARSGQTAPNRATLLRWVGDYQRSGLPGLASNHKGSQREWHGWEPLALHYWLGVGRMDPGSIAFWLRDEGHDSATYTRVRDFIKRLPETLGDEAPQRVGQHYYQQNIKPYKIRDYSNIPVGFCYEADGHAVDWYTLHPRSGNPARLELTVWIDWASHFVAGWMLWDRESGLNTLFSLSRAMIEHDHVPAAIHVDRGSGFRNRLMTHETTGFFHKFSIDPMFALAGNARGKGLVEGFFKHLEARLGKTHPTYCGHDRTDDGLRRMQTKIKRGELRVHTYQEVLEGLTRYMNAYNREPQAALGGRAPAQLWAGLKRTPLHTPVDAVIRLSEQRKVRSWRVELMNRTFQDIELSHHNKRDVIVEFDPGDWSQVWVYDLHKRFICVAKKVDEIAAMPDSYVADKEKARLEGQIARHERHIEEKERQAGLAITHDMRQADIDALNAGAAMHLTSKQESAGFEMNLGLGATTPNPNGTGAEPDDIDITVIDY